MKNQLKIGDKKLKKEITMLMNVIKAKNDLLLSYRIGRRPKDKSFDIISQAEKIFGEEINKTT